MEYLSYFVKYILNKTGALKSPSAIGVKDTKSFPNNPFEQPGLLSDAIPPPFGAHGAIFFMESSSVKGTESFSLKTLAFVTLNVTLV